LRHNIQTPHKKSLYANAKPYLLLPINCGCVVSLGDRITVSQIEVICINGGGNALPLREIGEYLVMFFVTIACFGEYRFMLAGEQLRVFM
jgi:hypothetical protein